MQNILIIVAVVILAGIGLVLFTGSENDNPLDTTGTTAMDGGPMPEPDAPVPAPEPSDPVDDTTTDPTQGMDIVETAVANDDFNTLVTAVTAAGLAETLQGEGPFTVFAPTDAAFASLPDGTVETLLQPENNADLAGVLTYHVLIGNVTADDLSDGMTVSTVNGAELTIGVSDAGVTVNDANVVMADIETSNGTIHVIDSVLLPPTE